MAPSSSFLRRTGGMSFISTFAQSAQRLSGNTQSTKLNVDKDTGGHRNQQYYGIGHGRGSRGHNLQTARNGALQWREYW